MSGTRTFHVTPDAGDPYRVTLDHRDGRVEARVELGDRAWTFAIEAGPEAGQVRVDDRPRRWTWRAIEGAPGRLVLDGREHRLSVETETERRLRSIRRAGPGESGARDVRAPMPGLVLEVLVAEGDRVEAGAGLVVVEAMKMENEVTAPVAGTVRDLVVERGGTVEGSALVCRIDPGAEP